MHMADALVSPAVGGVMWGATAVTAAYCVRKVRAQQDLDESKAPLMGIAGAFVFAAQMLNFTIPGTGSSGHIAGGLLLAILLGPEAAFLVMASILAVQALFFADGGLLALGCNIFNLGFFAAFVAFPYVYRPIVGRATTARRVMLGSIVGAVVALQLGALGVVLETTLSGVTELGFRQFVVLMLPIHLAIGVVEGLVTGAVVVFVLKAQPELLERSARHGSLRGLRLKPALIGLGVAALVVGGALSWFASANPDGLEWSVERITGSTEVDSTHSETRDAAAGVQNWTAILPDYAFRQPDTADGTAAGSDGSGRPAVDAGTSLSGVVGALIVVAVVVVIGLALRRRSPSGGASGP
jgi:cobalt/nickel transport system permease protein